MGTRSHLYTVQVKDKTQQGFQDKQPMGGIDMKRKQKRPAGDVARYSQRWLVPWLWQLDLQNDQGRYNDWLKLLEHITANAQEANPLAFV